ncbi:MAG: thiol:disulfide interchange protein DsbA/DsbL [Succinivibrio sp.]|nr:thiol:disulfide interchange protein DsbA/DsbL [Succinivibrio sp.]
MTISNFKRLTVALCCGLWLSAGVQAANYQEGSDYEIRGELTTVNPEIREFFSFYCGHCFKMQEAFDQVKEHFADRAEFVANPVGLIGGAMGEESQRAFAAAKLMGIEDIFAKELFDAIHVREELPEDHNFYKALFAKLGVSEERLEKQWHSFVVNGLISEFDNFAKGAAIDAVPELLVNGKYLVKMENIDTVDELIELIEYLLKKEPARGQVAQDAA